MALSDTRIHQIELLLTLDYLLNYTDEEHPATQQDICKHATKFGLKYDPNSTSGNDVRRQRIGDCLKFLKKVTERFPDQVPFILETTDTGKFYIEQKNYLNDEEILKILSAVKNDKYTQDSDTDYLVERLLLLLTNKNNLNFFQSELKKTNKHVRKFNSTTYRNIRLITKALSENKMIRINHETFDYIQKSIKYADTWYRVYTIKEFNNKPYALLIPVSNGDNKYFRGVIFSTIDSLNIPAGKDSEILAEDFNEHRDLNKLFSELNKSDYRHYETLEKMLESNVAPQGGFACVVSFYFNLSYANIIKQSFEQFFSKPLSYIECPSFDVVEKNPSLDNECIIPHKSNEKESVYGVSNILINVRAFRSWLLTDPKGDGLLNIHDLVNVVAPKNVNESLLNYYHSHYLRYKGKKSF